MEGLFDPELIAEPSILVHVPRLSFVLDDISHLTDDQLTQRALGLVPTLTLWALRDARHRGRVQQALSRWASVIQALAQAESGREALMTIFRYLSLVAQDLTPQTLLTTLAAVTPEAKETLMTTLAELWTAEGEARGRVEGEARGEARGRVEGVRRVLLQLGCSGRNAPQRRIGLSVHLARPLTRRERLGARREIDHERLVRPAS